MWLLFVEASPLRGWGATEGSPSLLHCLNPASSPSKAERGHGAAHAVGNLILSLISRERGHDSSCLSTGIPPEQKARKQHEARQPPFPGVNHYYFSQSCSTAWGVQGRQEPLCVRCSHKHRGKEAAEMTLQMRLPQTGEGIVPTRRSQVQIWPTHPHTHTQMQSTGAKALSSTCPRLCQSKGRGSESLTQELDWPRSSGHTARTRLLLQPLGFILLSALSLNHLVLECLGRS